MFRAGAVVAATLMLAGPDSGDPSTAELSRLEETWNQAHLQGDVNALDALWSDDLVVTVPRMAVLSKQDALAVTRAARMKFQRYHTSDLRIRIYGDSAVVTGRLQRARSMGEKVLEDDWRFIKVYVRESGRWRVVAFQASESAPRD